MENIFPKLFSGLGDPSNAGLLKQEWTSLEYEPADQKVPLPHGW